MSSPSPSLSCLVSLSISLFDREFASGSIGGRFGSPKGPPSGSNPGGNALVLTTSESTVTRAQSTTMRSPGIAYTAHWEEVRTKEALEKEEVFLARIKINAKKNKEAYATLDGLQVDVLLAGKMDQNRGVDGDQVVLRVKGIEAWESIKIGKLAQNWRSPARDPVGCLSEGMRRTSLSESKKHHRRTEETQSYVVGMETLKRLAQENPNKRPTAQVVAINKASRRREAVVGHLECKDKEKGILTLVARDAKLPHCIMYMDDIPNGLRRKIMKELLDVDTEKTLVLAKITKWQVKHPHPVAKVIKAIGMSGEIETESRAILEAENIHQDHDDFPPEAMECLPTTPWRLKEEDIEDRRDLRDARIFSIDPITARDLDDALSYAELANGCAEVGVHIADVSHFVPPESALDEEAQRRSTSVYLVQKVLPMLPRLLCEELCSLNAGVDRCAFSVIWVLDRDGNIKDQWMGKTIIRSCAKLSYEDAQSMLDGKFSAKPNEEPPTMLHGPHTWNEVVSDVRGLNRIAQRLRKSRFENGSLRLDNKKLLINLDDAGFPVGHRLFKAKDANRLVEEFMLLANRSVARFITEYYPDRSLLRRHPFPNGTKMVELVEFAKHHGIDLRAGSSKEIHESLQALLVTEQGRRAAQSIGLDVQTLFELMQILATEPMQLAMYFNTGDHEESDWRHFALAFDHYTHFTSPIRRYPDIIVHRLLSASLDAHSGRDPAESFKLHGNKDTDTLSDIAAHCNDCKLAAKNAQEASARLFLAFLLRDKPRVAKAIVVALNGDKFFEVYIPEYGLQRRVNVENDHPGIKATWDEEEGILELVGKPRPLWNDLEAPCDVVCGGSVEASLAVKVFASLDILLCCGGGKGKPLDVKAELLLE